MTARRGLRPPPAVMRLGMRQLGRRCLDPALPWPVQRMRLDQVTRISLIPRRTTVSKQTIAGLPAEVVSSPGPTLTVLHFHGGGYCPVVVSGDSAGGGLALALVLSMRDEGREPPAGVILLSPWLDLGRDRRAVPGLVRRDVVLTPDWLDACARADADPATWADHLVSPLHGTHAGLPPLLIQAGTEELLAPDAELLAARASAAGVDTTYTRWPGMWHDFVLLPGLLAAADSALAQASWFVRKVTAR